MLFKIIFLCCLSALLAKHVQLQDTPDALKKYFADIDAEVKALHHETAIQIRSNQVPLSFYIQNAKKGIINNITVAAVPYWAKIRALEETAQAKGQDISICVDLGDNQLYALNNSVIAKAEQRCDYYSQTGYSILNNSAAEAGTVIEELIVLEQLVELCNDDVCATDLTSTVTQFYSRAKNILNDAESNARNYVLIFLPELLSYISLDTESYVAQYSVILNQVSDCIEQL